MDIKTLLGESYKEGMTLDEINTALADKTFVDPSTLPKSVDKSVFDKTASELSAANKKLKELAEKTMTDDERLKAAEEKAILREKEFTKKMNRLDVEKIFVAGGLTEADYSGIIDNVVSEDSEKSLKLANDTIALIKNQKSAIEKELKAELLKNTPRPPVGQGTNNPKANLEKQLVEANARGDYATVAAITRQIQETTE